MKTLIAYLLTTITLIALMNACGPSAEEQQRQRQQALRDSLERVRLQQFQQQRMDSIARAQAVADSIAAAEREAEQARRQIQFNPDGKLAVQVEAWRSEDKAQTQVSKWRDRGFENAYVVKHGNAETGDIWFRVRLGRVSTMEMAQRLGANIQAEYNENYWISMTGEESASQTTIE